MKPWIVFKSSVEMNSCNNMFEIVYYAVEWLSSVYMYTRWTSLGVIKKRLGLPLKSHRELWSGFPVGFPHLLTGIYGRDSRWDDRDFHFDWLGSHRDLWSGFPLGLTGTHTLFFQPTALYLLGKINNPYEL